MCVAVVAAVAYMIIDATLGVKYYKQFKEMNKQKQNATEDVEQLENDSGGGI